MAKPPPTDSSPPAGPSPRESDEPFRLIFERHNSVMILIDYTTGAIVDANPAATSFYGYSRERMRRLRITDLNQLPPAQVWECLRRAGRGQKNWFEFPHRLANGEIRQVEVHSSPIEYQEKRLLFSIIHDITDRKRIEAELRQRDAELAHTARLSTMGEMAAELAHEINQPLYAIANYAEACHALAISRDLAKMDELVSWTRQISLQARRAGDIVRRINQFTRKAESTRAATDINDVARDAAGLLEAEARSSGVQMQFHLDPALPQPSADRILVLQVFVNLMRNAFDAMINTPPALRVLTITTSTTDGEVEAVVSDMGRGIDPAVQHNLFEPFVTTRPQGTGMGLAICRSTIESHGGRIWVADSDSGGASFHFTLPIS